MFARLASIGLILAATLPISAQTFPDRVMGQWEGMMYIHKEGAVRDSVEIRLTISKGAMAGTWPWVTQYLSPKMPRTKDYTLRLTDADKQTYVMDEGGVVLVEHLFGDKLYCVFETEGIMLTSSYELRDEHLIFEVTSGKRLPGGSVISYSVTNLQRAILKRVP